VIESTVCPDGAGRLDEAAALLQGEEGKPLPDSARLLFLRDSNAGLRIPRGDPEGGLAETLDAGRRYDADGSRNPAFSSWRSQAALVLHGLGQQDEARRLAGEEVEVARTWALRWRSAPRCVSRCGRRRDGVAMLEEAVEVLSGSPTKLEHARRAPSWEAPFTASTAARRRASSFDVRSNSQRSAGQRRWSSARRASSLPPAHALAASP
jgi:hypothetical protein